MLFCRYRSLIKVRKQLHPTDPESLGYFHTYLVRNIIYRAKTEIT